ncbi:hypothetical protein B0O99DRAFT_656141 [Bisporella sp. PMI_857]|nr:hypothetical protein B0O99DRAFT_656141 [Bisporella sp. PMI_857]
MDDTFDKTAAESIDLLEARLRRIEYAVCGQTDIAEANTKVSAMKRLAQLEHSLHQLASKSQVVQDLLRLHARHPDLFQSISPEEVPSTLDTSSILSIILASASSYPSTASRLTSILDVPIPPAEQSAQLIELIPRIAKAEAIQASQNTEIASLRERSAELIYRWHTGNTLQQGDGWAESVGKLEQVERRVRRLEFTKRIDDGIVE